MKKLYAAYLKIIGADKNFIDSNEHVQVTGDSASEIIRQKLLSDKPVMIGRFGGTELNTILNYYFTQGNLIDHVSNLVKGIPYFSGYKQGLVHDINTLAGVFPNTPENLDRFSQLYLQDAPEIDVLGSWMACEKYLYKQMATDLVRIQLEDLSPFNHAHPWSKALEGKKVLVIHPFEDSIRSQYAKRDLLFKNKDVLPAFELKIIKAIQTYPGNETIYKDWFQVLDVMTSQVANTDFDIAILGCGAYGMPLAASIKRMGKKAIHIGGAVQCLFGIKGKRWEIPQYNYQERFYNDNWVRPLESEKPKNASKVEGGTYW